jgi:uncharacterized protein (TIRG00374 family)
MSSSLLRKLIPGLALGFLVLVILSLLGDIQQVGSLILHFNWWIFPMALLCTLFNYSLRFLKWDFYLRQVGVKNFTWLESLRLFVAGFPLAMTPGKVGEVFKAVWINQRCELPVARGVSVVVAERISDGLAVLMLSTLGVLAYPQYWPGFLIALVVLVAAVVISQIRPLASGCLGLGEKIPLVRRAIPALRDFYEGSFSLFRPGTTLLAVGLGTLSWFGEGIGFYLILLGLGLPPSMQLFGTAVFILAFSVVIGAVTALPGGIGASEASIAGMLVLVGGLPGPTAAAATLLIRLATLWFGVALGLVAWALSPQLLGLQTKMEPPYDNPLVES